ncbi:ATP-binding protein [Acetobacteraceae bacterium KSS8]|uniref:ATP-binding protein n=1 Tax=Endosaccharibacter trunci TaxID=2812733 RepID=A0ABT1WDY0_9PROT|nr:ATP-binding protein [Acetobacteraceae bacterium KSS8]
MIDTALDQIALDDIERLVLYGRSEGVTLDFKEAFPSADHKGTRDFLADVTAFANTDGGDIIIGVREDGNGTAAELVGIDTTGLDEALRRIDDQLRNCVDPRVPLFRVRIISLANGRSVLVMRVGASLIAPHRVVFDRSSRFYRRGNRSNYEMSTAELRQAFAASNDLPKRIRDLHRKAVEATAGTDMPCRIQDGPAAVLTIAPLSILREAREVNFTREVAILPPRHTSNLSMVIGLEGVIVHSPVDAQTGGVRSWSINHRLGYLDFAWVIGHQDQGQKLVWPKYFVPELKGIVSFSISRLRSLGIEGPWIAMLTLAGIRGYRIVAGDGYMTDPAWQDPAYLGEIIDDAMAPEALRPFTEGFWRLFGVDRPPASHI